MVISRNKMQPPATLWISIIVTTCVSFTRAVSPCSIPSNGTIVCEGSIPRELPEGITTVKVDNMVNVSSGKIDISSSLFGGRNWDKVKHLAISMNMGTTLCPKAFVRVKQIEHLEIHSADHGIDINADAFIGLDNTKSLDLSDCLYLKLENFISALNGSNKMQRLQNVTLVNIAKRWDPLILDRGLISVLASKHSFTSVDLSKNFVKAIDCNALVEQLCKRPLYFILSGCTFIRHSFAGVNRSCSTIQMLDFGYSNFNLAPIPIRIPENKTFNFSANSILNFIFHTDTLILAGILSKEVIDIRKVSLSLNEKDTFTLRNLSLADNHLRYLDLKLVNFLKSIEHLDLSKNSMVYLQPKFLFENNSLSNLDLSQNKLNEMVNTNYSDFLQLLNAYKKLKYFDISGNGLTFLPRDFFVNNVHLKVINLSHNRLQQFESSLYTYGYLLYLDISNNEVTRLSNPSIMQLQSLINEDDAVQIDLRNNTIECNRCECNESVKWILNAKDAVISNGVCTNAKGNTVVLDDQVLADIVDMCQLQKRILIGTITSVLGVIFIVTTVFVIRKRLRKNSRERTRRKVIQKFRERQHKFRFVTFLGFSGEDGHFVQEHVLEPLNHHLREWTGATRDLVCTGDRHFKLGCTIADQMDESCEKCGSVILVISSAFCKSPHCNNEMHIAYINRKPIILMFKERVEEEDMTPLLRVIFKQFTRVTWTTQDGQYRLSTSWENVCESLIDCMGANRPGVFF